MLFLLNLIKRNDETSYENSYMVTGIFDKLLLVLGVMYGFMWVGNLFNGYFTEDHGQFFDHIGLITGAYFVTVLTAFATKTIFYHRLFAVTSFAVMAFLLSFATFGAFISMIIAIVVAIVCGTRNLESNFVTGTMIGYWMVLFFTSSLEYHFFGAITEGFWATIVEGWTIAWNSVGFEVFNKGLTGFGAIFALVFGYFFNKYFSESKKHATTETASVSLRNKQVFNNLFAGDIKQNVQNRLKGQEPIQETVASQEPIIIKEMPKEATPTETSKPIPTDAVPSKKFFNINTPFTKKKMNNMKEDLKKRFPDLKENILRRLSK